MAGDVIMREQDFRKAITEYSQFKQSTLSDHERGLLKTYAEMIEEKNEQIRNLIKQSPSIKHPTDEQMKAGYMEWLESVPEYKCRATFDQVVNWLLSIQSDK